MTSAANQDNSHEPGHHHDVSSGSPFLFLPFASVPRAHGQTSFSCLELPKLIYIFHIFQLIDHAPAIEPPTR
jgi:hypothetical protein